MTNNQIIIKGARTNNLKNINLTIPKNKLVIMTGLSGSGKTSLAFDTIYAEGQRRYVESLSAYARQFLGGIEKPDVDNIEGLSPAISIDQKSTNNNPRSTVGTVTEIYDYIRLLYARIGTPYCPNHNIEINASTITQMVDKLMILDNNTKIEILAPIIENQKGSHKDLIDKLIKDGFTRAYIDNQPILLEEVKPLNKTKKHNIEIIIDRIIKNDNSKSRLYDSLETCLKLTKGISRCKYNNQYILFSSNFSCPICNFSIPKLEPRLFSFNNPLGACHQCNGLGYTQSVDKNILIKDPNKSIKEGTIKLLSNIVDTTNIDWLKQKELYKAYNIDYTIPFHKYTKAQLDIIFYGSKEPIKYTIQSSSGNIYTRNDYIEGVISLIERRHLETTSRFAKEYYQSYMSESLCPICKGQRLNQYALSIKVNNLTISQLTNLSIEKTYNWINKLKLTTQQQLIAKLVLNEIKERLKFLIDVGLEYLTLDRMAKTLSGGESQRIRLATQIGSNLTGVLYVLDEPSIGLHQKDNTKLINTLKKMRDLGNSLIVVEHDEETMLESDYIIDIGPKAGQQGGYVVATGNVTQIKNNNKSITGQYLSNKLTISYPKLRRKGNGHKLSIIKANANNLKNINVNIKLGCFNVVSGVSGSGKSSLVNEVITKTLIAHLNPNKAKTNYNIKGLQYIDKIISISQDPIGRTPRSNPVTYTGIFDDIRDLFSLTVLAKQKGYDKGRFSFNIKGGRCESCQGDGVKKVSMHFLPDVYVNCSECDGKRYNEETLQVTYKDKNIFNILDMTIDEAIIFFDSLHKIRNRLIVLQEVGLGYIKLGQSATTLSGGEAQRVKLASELQRKATSKTLFVLDEPTTGLHSYDVNNLLKILQRIVDNGDTIIVIEHNLDIIKNADYIIDLGPNGGDKGGYVIADGTPEEVANNTNSYTGEYLRRVLK